MQIEQPNYYGILPATVRYDGRITPAAKVLYTELSALTNKEGFCWASNEYFAGLYNTHERSIRRMVSQLETAGHITVELIPNGKGTIRRIRMTADIHGRAIPAGQNCPAAPDSTGQNCPPPQDKNVPRSMINTSNNNTRKATVPVFELPLSLTMIEGFEKAWADWTQHRKETRHPLTPKAIEKQIAFLNEQPDPVAVINKSIQNGWQGLFELKDGKNNGKPKSRYAFDAGKYPTLSAGQANA